MGVVFVPVSSKDSNKVETDQERTHVIYMKLIFYGGT